MVFEEIENLSILSQRLQDESSIYAKLQILDEEDRVRSFLQQPTPLKTFLSALSPECEYVIKSIIAIGQAEKVFSLAKWEGKDFEKARSLLHKLIEIEDFYKELGGIIGYHLTLLRLLSPQQKKVYRYFSPAFTNISIPTKEIRKRVIEGIKNITSLALIYPLGGAADRLHLQDPVTKKQLPAAKLVFAGKPLISTLLHDVEAKEYLHYKLFNHQVTIPIAIMTSTEKFNHKHILGLFQENGWFDRSKEDFFLFIQPSAPTLTEDGIWCMRGPFEMLLKPGGHGVIWKLAREKGVFDWLHEKRKTKALVRQINNPIAGLDYSLLAFLGEGYEREMNFGFASCSRLYRAAEGINVVIEREQKGEYNYTLTNIEYCDFEKYDIHDLPERGGKYSKFPSNTNILFVDLQAVEKASKALPFPGMLINLKKVTFQDEKGRQVEKKIGRLESLMQNIADFFVETYHNPLEEKRLNKSYLTYNHRYKTISTAKKVYRGKDSVLETPENCFYDLLHNHRELFSTYCQIDMPDLGSIEDYLEKGPPFIVLYHPSLGPIYSVIAQKIKRGKWDRGAELRLDISELKINNLDLEGSLIIEARDLMGHKDNKGQLVYSERCGRCILENVQVKNRGIDWKRSRGDVWKCDFLRREKCHIILHGNSEFYAKDVTLSQDHLFVVEDGHILYVTEKEGKLNLRKEVILEPRWWWEYFIDEDFNIVIHQKVYLRY